MIPKFKAPHLNRHQRRHPQRGHIAVGGAAPSNLLVTLMIRNGYWPDNSPLGSFAGWLEGLKQKRAEAERAVPEPVAQGVFAKAWGRVKKFFGR